MSAPHDPLSHHKKAYFVVWILLLCFTVTTVWVAYHNFGIFNIVVAMGIASVKAALVILYFMHLKYDNRTNQVVFISAFFFLFIFIALTLSDELVRPLAAKAKVEVVAMPAAVLAAQHEKLRIATPVLIARGQGLFAVQCQACHGPEGRGNGPAAGALNPKPRDFTSGYWKQGGTPAQVFKTVSEGIAGTGMASFASLPVEDRWALIHFVRSLSPQTPDDTPETLAAAGLTTDTSKTAVAAPPTVHLPIEFAIDRVVEDAAKQKQ